MRHRYIIKKKQDSICDLIKGAHDAWSGWVCVLFVGLVTGVVAGVIDIGASWMSDLKYGICPQAFWLNREQCCWSSNETTFDKGNCSQVSHHSWCIWRVVRGSERVRTEVWTLCLRDKSLSQAAGMATEFYIVQCLLQEKRMHFCF
jgi:chloride channel 3/4/5